MLLENNVAVIYGAAQHKIVKWADAYGADGG
jgi:hypothetical protein